MGRLAHGIFAVKQKPTLVLAGLVLALSFIGLAVFSNQLFPSEHQKEIAAKSQTPLPTDHPASDLGQGINNGSAANKSTQNKSDTNNAYSRNDINSSPNPGPTTDGSEAENNQNLTYSLTKNLLQSGVLSSIDQNGNLTDTGFLQNISLPQNLNPEVLVKPQTPLRAKDLVINPASDPPAVKQYFNELYAAYKNEPALYQGRGDLAILNDALQSADYEKLKALDPIIAALERAVRAAKKIPVPESQTQFALKELNYLLQTKRAIEIFRNTEKDPIATALTASARIQILQKMAELHLQTKNVLTEKGIVFNPNEGGYAYFK